MNEGTRSGKSTICLLGISAERPTNGLYLYLYNKSLAYATLAAVLPGGKSAELGPNKKN
jgi:hypothetical protein